MSRNGTIDLPLEVKSVDEAVAVVISTIMKKGELVHDKKSRQGNFIETRNLQFVLTEPLKRIAVNKKRPINLIVGVARFVWMISGSDRVEDIAYYQPQIRFYTDNGLSVPGSNYGTRLFQPQAGIDQIHDVIEILKENPASRRACASIWQPTDASRLSSKDMPCAFGLNFEIRNGKLFSTLVMRSNNAVTLLHVNLFEFTLLGEIVARELGVEYGGHVHYVFSMHIFQTDEAIATETIKFFKKIDVDDVFFTMPTMPSEPSALEEAKKLARFEAELRNQNVFKDLISLDDHLEKAKNHFHPYWYEFYKILAIGTLVRIENFKKAFELAHSLEPYFRWSMISQLKILEKKVTDNKKLSLDVFIDEEKSKFENLKSVYSLSTDDKNIFKNKVQLICREWDKTHFKKKSTANIVKQVINVMLQSAATVAASSEYKKHHPSTKNFDDYLKVSKKEVFGIIRDILDKNDQRSSKLM